MMRNVGKKIKVNKYVEMEEVVTKETISTIVIRPELKTVDVTIVLSNSEDKTVGENSIVLSGENYLFLFSADPFFDEGKQEGSYREIDLWKMIDKINAE